MKFKIFNECLWVSVKIIDSHILSFRMLWLHFPSYVSPWICHILSLSYPTALSVLRFSLKFISLFTAAINPICPDECALILMCLPSLNGSHPLKPVHLFFWHRLHLSFIVEIHNSEYYYKEMPQRSISLLYRTSVYVKKLFQIATIFYISELLGRR